MYVKETGHLSLSTVVAVRRQPIRRRNLYIVSSPDELPIEFRPTKFGLVSWVVLVKHSQEPACNAAAVFGG